MHDFLDVMNEYLRGERMTGYAIVAIGVGLLAFAFVVWRTQEGPFMWGLAGPLAIVGVMATTVGPFFAVSQSRLAEDLSARFDEDPVELARAERARMEKVNANWPRLKLAWATAAVTGLGLLLLVHQPWARGLGLALVLLVAILFSIDTFAERRAVPYTEAVRALAGGDDPSD